MITNEELMIDLQRVTNLLGHPPSYEDMRTHGNFGPRTFQRRLGPSWTEVKRKVGWEPSFENFNPESISPQDGGWLSGLIDGEGCFIVSPPSPTSNKGKSRTRAPRFTISLRSDDVAMLEELKRIVNVKNRLYIDNQKSNIERGIKAKPAFKFSIQNVPGLLFHLIPILEKYPLRSKKKYELPLFKMALVIIYNKYKTGYANFGYTDSEKSALDRISLALKELKVYMADTQAIYKKYDLKKYLDNPLLIDELSHGSRKKNGDRPAIVYT